MSSKHSQEENNQREAALDQVVVAGEIHVACACCDRPRWLVTHPALDAARRACPRSGKTYLDRGDGLFAPDGQRLAPDALGQTEEPSAAAAQQSAASGEPDVLSDRPSRSGPQGSAKSRISLERATFAAASGQRR
jgi:hypothetical protein